MQTWNSTLAYAFRDTACISTTIHPRNPTLYSGVQQVIFILHTPLLPRAVLGGDLLIQEDQFIHDICINTHISMVRSLAMLSFARYINVGEILGGLGFLEP